MCLFSDLKNIAVMDYVSQHLRITQRKPRFWSMNSGKQAGSPMPFSVSDFVASSSSSFVGSSFNCVISKASRQIACLSIEHRKNNEVFL